MVRSSLAILCVGFVALAAAQLADENGRAADGSSLTAVDLLQNIYNECLQEGSFSCVKPKVLAFLSTSMAKDKIRLTRDLTIVSSDSTQSPSSSIYNEVSKVSGLDADKKEELRLMALDKLDQFLHNHELRIRIPKEITTGELPSMVPKILTKNLPEEIKIPLAGSDSEASTGRSKKFLKRVVMPFLIGLKFKATTLIPLAFALIALKTWKALTLALLSIVLSGAMVIFKFSKPKVNYEVIHYPQPVPVFDAHHHPHEYAHHIHEYAHAHGRQLDAQEMAYNGQL